MESVLLCFYKPLAEGWGKYPGLNCIFVVVVEGNEEKERGLYHLGGNEERERCLPHVWGET